VRNCAAPASADAQRSASKHLSTSPSSARAARRRASTDPSRSAASYWAPIGALIAKHSNFRCTIITIGTLHLIAAARLLDHLVEAMDLPFDIHEGPLTLLEQAYQAGFARLFATEMSEERHLSWDDAVQAERCAHSANKCAADLEQRPPGVRTSRDALTRSHRRQRASKKALIEHYTKDEKGTKLGLYRLSVVFQSGFSPREYLRVHVNAGRDKVYELLAGVGMAFAEFGSQCWRALPVAADRRLSCVARSGDPFDALLLAPVGDDADPSTLLRAPVADKAWHAKLMSGGVKVGDVLRVGGWVGDVFRVGGCSFKVTEVHDVRGKPDDDGVRVNVVFSGEETLSSLFGEAPARRPSWLTESAQALYKAGYEFEHGKGVLLGRLGVSMTLSFFSVWESRWKTVAVSVRRDLGAKIDHELVNVGGEIDGDGKPLPWHLEDSVDLDDMPLSIPFEPRPGVNLSPRVQARIEELRAEGFKGDPVRKAEREKVVRDLLVEVKEAHDEEYREKKANARRRREARLRGEPLDETDSDDDWDDYDEDDEDDDRDESGSLVSSMALMAKAFEGTSLTESMPPPAPVADAPVAATPMEEGPFCGLVLPMNPPSVLGSDT
jgi:hypothetical protein